VLCGAAGVNGERRDTAATVTVNYEAPEECFLRGFGASRGCRVAPAQLRDAWCAWWLSTVDE
jgi:hypothetical protein